jgi:hypothetical protein
MMIISQCLKCNHFIKITPDLKLLCKAFPEGAPPEFSFPKAKHLEKIEGQVGEYVYEEK